MFRNLLTFPVSFCHNWTAFVICLSLGVVPAALEACAEAFEEPDAMLLAPALATALALEAAAGIARPNAGKQEKRRTREGAINMLSVVDELNM